MIRSLRLLSIQVGLPADLTTTHPGDGRERQWSSGIYKTLVQGPVWVSRTNLAGDGQADPKNHGGADKAVYAYPSEHYPAWCAELSRSSLAPGSFGENLTTVGLVEDTICIGDVLSAGGAVLQVSQPRGPCWKLARRLEVKDMVLRVNDNGRTGFYLRVLQEGYLEAGQTLALVERPLPGWTVLRAHRLRQDVNADREAARTLSEQELLAQSWRSDLQKKLSAG